MPVAGDAAKRAGEDTRALPADPEGASCAGGDYFRRQRQDLVAQYQAVADAAAAAGTEVRLRKCTSSRVKYPATGGGSRVILSWRAAGRNPGGAGGAGACAAGGADCLAAAVVLVGAFRV